MRGVVLDQGVLRALLALVSRDDLTDRELAFGRGVAPVREGARLVVEGQQHRPAREWQAHAHAARRGVCHRLREPCDGARGQIEQPGQAVRADRQFERHQLVGADTPVPEVGRERIRVEEQALVPARGLAAATGGE